MQSRWQRIRVGATVVASLVALASGVAFLVAPSAAHAGPWTGRIVNDAISSWWSRPNAEYQPRHGITYMTGVSSAGDWVWNAYDHKSGVNTRVVLGRLRHDDHNTPAIIAPPDRPPIVFYTGHRTSTVIWMRTGKRTGDWAPGPERALPMPGTVTYLQVHRGRTPDTLLLLSRSGNRWLLAVSEDWGKTWTVRPLVRFDVPESYLITAQLPDGTIRLCAAGHPTKSDQDAFYYGEIDPLGDFRNAGGDLIANIYSGEGLPISATGDLTMIYARPEAGSARLFEVGKGAEPEVIAAEWEGQNEASYVYLHRGSQGWESTRVVAAGRPIGYEYDIRYLGGATFANAGAPADIYLSRETSGTWRIERWRLEASGWASSVVVTDTDILARPTVPRGASMQLPLLWLDLTSYEDYTHYTGSTHALLADGRPAPGRPGVPVAGDWDGDGVTDPGVFKSGAWSLRVGSQVVSVRLGRKGDRPVVGDWDGDGADELGVYRDGEWILADGLAPRVVTNRFAWGDPGDVALAGDWDGDGVDGIAVRRGTRWYYRNHLSAGAHDGAFSYGRSGDVAVAGDWNGDGSDSIGVRRGREWILRENLDAGVASERFSFGLAGDVPVVGDWGSEGRDAPGVRRPSDRVWYVIDSAAGVPEADLAPNRFLF